MIREISNSDIKQVLDLLLSYSDNKHIDENYIENDLKNDYSKYLVYEDNGIIVGMINYHIFDNYAEIIDIVVKEEYRRKHIGTKLIKRILNELNNYDMTLEVKEDNTSAIKLYESIGFRIVSTRKHYYGEKDAYIMSMKVSD